MVHDDQAGAGSRLGWLDEARGVAVLAMVVFHLSWDLSFFGIVDWPVANHIGWLIFARMIASTFLIVSGVNFYLAHYPEINRDKFWRRLLIVCGAAAIITISTLVATPEFYIFFGILHAIAVGSLLLMIVHRLDGRLLLAVAIGVVIIGANVSDPRFDGGWLLWLGLNERHFLTSDFVPIFPFFGAILSGFTGAKLLGRARMSRILGSPARSGIGSLLAMIGRNSLWIYLVHQPPLIALLSGWLWLTS